MKRFEKHFSIFAITLLLETSIGLAREQIGLDGPGWHLWLDRQAEWKSDELYIQSSAVEGTRLQIPAVDLSRLPVNAPTCGWEKIFADSVSRKEVNRLLDNPLLSVQVNVPGTVEEYCWDMLAGEKARRNQSAPVGDYVGVSWWGRDFEVKALAPGQRVMLKIEGVRQRCEVYVNRQLVGYEILDMLPFEVDVTKALRQGRNQLALRVTDPGGTFSWGEYRPQEWGGDTLITMSHGFGGITGKVTLETVDPVQVQDIYIRNTPAITAIDAEIRLVNGRDRRWQGDLEVAIESAFVEGRKVETPEVVHRQVITGVAIEPHQASLQKLTITVPGARVWDIRKGNLYRLVARLQDAQGLEVDRNSERFGFRWFEVAGHLQDATYQLNGRRIFLVGAICVGYWPQNGIFATEAMARLQYERALELGFNCLPSQRHLMMPNELDVADEMGVLTTEEPGGYLSGELGLTGKEETDKTDWKRYILRRTMARNKLLRMVARDRNHPSLVVTIMQNEAGMSPNDSIVRDLQDAHLLDPSRSITYSSGFQSPGTKSLNKLHMIANDSTLYRDFGWCDEHHASGKGVYLDSLYQSPQSYLNNYSEKREVLHLGEEWAMGTPPRLGTIVRDNEVRGHNGWDGTFYKNWHDGYAEYLKEKGWSRYFPSVDALVTSMGDVSYYFHGRILENTRMNNVVDAYIANLWECEPYENHSGLVDLYRNFKGTPKLITDYTRDLYVAVKARAKLCHVGDTSTIDLWLVNNHVLKAGTTCTVQLEVTDPRGRTRKLAKREIKVTGGDTLGELSVEALECPLNAGKGYYRLNAALFVGRKQVADGHEELLAVDWKSMVPRLSKQGALATGNMAVEIFVNSKTHLNLGLPYFISAMLPLHYIVATGGEPEFEPIPYSNFRTLDGKSEGLNMTIFKGAENFEKPLDKRIAMESLDNNDRNSFVGEDRTGKQEFALRWEGFLIPDKTGNYIIKGAFDDWGKVWLNGTNIMSLPFTGYDMKKDGWPPAAEVTMHLEAGKSYPLTIDYFQKGWRYGYYLKWKMLGQPTYDRAELLRRVKEDGTTLLIVKDAEQWMKFLEEQKVVGKTQFIIHPGAWVGSMFAVRDHPFFDQLPVNQAMNWEHQLYVRHEGAVRSGFIMQGEDAIVASVAAHNHFMTTSVGIIPHGKGKIVFSTLDMLPSLVASDKASNGPKLVFCNFLKWAGEQQ